MGLDWTGLNILRYPYRKTIQNGAIRIFCIEKLYPSQGKSKII